MGTYSNGSQDRRLFVGQRAPTASADAIGHASCADASDVDPAASIVFTYGLTDAGNGQFSFGAFEEPIAWGGTYDLQAPSRLVLVSDFEGAGDYDVAPNCDALCKLTAFTLSCTDTNPRCRAVGYYQPL